MAASVAGHGQVTITATDMFNQAGLYYQGYANYFDPNDSTTSYPTAGVMGATGGPQLWDFTTGPTNQVFRFDYLAASNVAEAVSFTNATLVERKTVVGGTNTTPSDLFFTQVPGVGRTVYGFYDTTFSAETPANVFSPPIVDFPDQIHYNDTWTTSTMITTTIDVPLVGMSFPSQVTFSSQFTVDAWA